MGIYNASPLALSDGQQVPDQVDSQGRLLVAGSDTALPTENSAFAYVMQAPQKTFRCGFEAAVAAGVDTAFFTAVATGAVMRKLYRLVGVPA